jgi:hypothetical protein
VGGWDLRCARRLEGLSASGFREIFDAFCDRTKTEFQPEYVAPLAFAQMTFPDSVLDQS